jgi:uncharacterized protein YbgA (DUF1722 family)
MPMHKAIQLYEEAGLNLNTLTREEINSEAFREKYSKYFSGTFDRLSE